MGYSTTFSGEIEIVPPLNPYEIDYLRRFHETRRMKRGRGPYFAAEVPRESEDRSDVEDINEYPDGQPGHWCQWVPDEEGKTLGWDGVEKFYDSTEWMAYLIDHFLKPGAAVQTLLETPLASEEEREAFRHFTFDHVCNGVIDAQGEDPDDHWLIRVVDNKVSDEPMQEVTEAEANTAVKHGDALAQIAALLPTEDDWRSAADFMASVAEIIEWAGVERPEHYED